MNEKISEIFRKQEVYDLDGNPHRLDSNISQAEAEELYNIVTARKPLRTVEVGFAKGISALTILSAKESYDTQKTGMHHVIDPFQREFQYCGLAMAKRLDLDAQLVFHEKFPEEVIPGMESLDFAFVDASHLFDLSLMEFVLIDKKLKVGGIIGFHDLWMPSLQTLVRFILKNRHYKIINHRVPPPIPGWKKGLSRFAGKMPMIGRYCSSDFLEPFSTLGIPNLVLLEKISDDKRDWRFHQKF